MILGTWPSGRSLCDSGRFHILYYILMLRQNGEALIKFFLERFGEPFFFQEKGSPRIETPIWKMGKT